MPLSVVVVLNQMLYLINFTHKMNSKNSIRHAQTIHYLSICSNFMKNLTHFLTHFRVEEGIQIFSDPDFNCKEMGMLKHPSLFKGPLWNRCQVSFSLKKNSSILHNKRLIWIIACRIQVWIWGKIEKVLVPRSRKCLIDC